LQPLVDEIVHARIALLHANGEAFERLGIGNARDALVKEDGDLDVAVSGAEVIGRLALRCLEKGIDDIRLTRQDLRLCFGPIHADQIDLDARACGPQVPDVLAQALQAPGVIPEHIGRVVVVHDNGDALRCGLLRMGTQAQPEEQTPQPRHHAAQLAPQARFTD